MGADRSIELDRRFLEIPEVSGEVEPDQLVRASLALGRGETWQQLLDHRYVVVLGEAGTGKTTEFQRQAAALTRAGAYAFFVEVASLARDDLRASLVPDAESQLDTWQDSQEEAVFFLDSLDEAKLQRHTLRDALRKLKRELRTAWDRVRLIISCRGSDWRADADRADVQDISDDDDHNVRVVQIAPLGEQQVAGLAAHVGVPDVEGFKRAVAENYLQDFLHRPLDVLWLGIHWQRHHGFGSLRELIVENIRQKLNEPTERPSVLSLEKAEAGASALAGIATLTRRASILVPGEPPDVLRAGSAIDPNEVLSDWSREEVQDLLRRALFDESTYGRVRFHHRSIQEFLAASWLHELLGSGLPRRTIRDLILREEAGESVVPEHLEPILAWLCLWDAPLRAETVHKAPTLLIAYGDPAGFDMTDRTAILRSYASGYAVRGRRFDRFDLPSLERFASPALAEALSELLAEESAPDELRAMLFQLVEHGQVTACVPHALETALDVSASERTRVAAIRAVERVGDNGERIRLLSLLTST